VLYHLQVIRKHGKRFLIVGRKYTCNCGSAIRRSLVWYSCIDQTRIRNHQTNCISFGCLHCHHNKSQPYKVFVHLSPLHRDNFIIMDHNPTPYINLEYQQSDKDLNINISPDPYDSFDFGSSPPFPHTPSYNGSYHNSPYSANSELSFTGQEQDSFALFDDESQQHNSYDPSEYDHPISSSLLMFPADPDFSTTYDHNPQVSVSAPNVDHRTFDYSSPSSNGGGESGPEGELVHRSRRSSLSESHRTSPRLDVAQTFENMRFESPNWAHKSLPLDRPLSPSHKPHSPPQLRIPGSPNANSAFPPPPTINAPAGDGGLMSGPQLHIVPATPVSGGGAQPQAVPFQSTLRQGKHRFHGYL
jgi:hypothetical protein